MFLQQKSEILAHIFDLYFCTVFIKMAFYSTIYNLSLMMNYSLFLEVWLFSNEIRLFYNILNDNNTHLLFLLTIKV